MCKLPKKKSRNFYFSSATLPRWVKWIGVLLENNEYPKEEKNYLHVIIFFFAVAFQLEMPVSKPMMRNFHWEEFHFIDQVPFYDCRHVWQWQIHQKKNPITITMFRRSVKIFNNNKIAEMMVLAWQHNEKKNPSFFAYACRCRLLSIECATKLCSSVVHMSRIIAMIQSVLWQLR